MTNRAWWECVPPDIMEGWRHTDFNTGITYVKTGGEWKPAYTEPQPKGGGAEAMTTEADFDAMYGNGMMAKIMNIINDLAPTTRRDEWWATAGPYEILATHLMSSDGEEQKR